MAGKAEQNKRAIKTPKFLERQVKCNHFTIKENAGSFISAFQKISFYCIFKV